MMIDEWIALLLEGMVLLTFDHWSVQNYKSIHQLDGYAYRLFHGRRQVKTRHTARRTAAYKES